MAASMLWAAVTAWKSPVRCRLSCSMGSTCEYPAPAAPPLIPKVGPIEGWRNVSTDVRPMWFNPWASPTAVVVLPSPSGVGVMAVITTYFAIGRSAIVLTTDGSILATWRPYGTRYSSSIPSWAAISTGGRRVADWAISRSEGRVGGDTDVIIALSLSARPGATGLYGIRLA